MTKRKPRTRLRTPPPAPPKPLTLDRGIARAVDVLRAAGVETCQSCEGGPGHAYPEPTIEFYGNSAAGWLALKVCLDYGFPVRQLRRFWTVQETNIPTGPHWAITFRDRIY
jgi:hypothetical protein